MKGSDDAVQLGGGEDNRSSSAAGTDLAYSQGQIPW